MKTIKIFLASSNELSEEREKFVLFLNSIGKIHQSLRLEPIMWETDIPSGSYQKERVQDEINPYLKKSEIIILLIYSKLGKFTLEEYELAKTKKKKIFIYFKTGFSSKNKQEHTNYGEVLDLKEKIEQENKLLFKEFDNIEQFENSISKDLNLYLSQISVKPTRRTKKIAPKSVKLPPEIPKTYLNWLKEYCSYMDIDKLQEKSDVIQVKLPEIYIPLYAYEPAIIIRDKNKVEEKDMQVDIEDLVGKNESLLIEGHPGSGKSTFLKHLAYSFTQGTNIKELNNFLPVLVFLKDLNLFFNNNGEVNKKNATVEEILSYYFSRIENVIDFDTVKKFCKAKKALFLLDGLDEIEPEHRKVVVNSFANFRIKNEGNKVVFTGRPHGMESAVIKRFGDNHIKILSLNMEQIEAFIRKWFHYVYSEGSRIGEKNAETMIGEMKDHPAIGTLTDNPLMLTAICILYHDGKELPGQRAELYRKFVNNLLYRRFGNDYERIYEFLRTLAFEMHKKNIRNADRSLAIKTLSKIYEKDEGEKDNDYKKRIEDLFDDIEPRCGLLKFENSQYLFWHLTFQEFLTAVYIICNSTDYAKAISDYWEDDHYKEVIELYIGYLSIENKKWANQIVENVLKAKEKVPFKKWLLASKSIIDIHKDTRDKKVIKTARERLLSIIDSHSEPKILADAGETLGWLGDTRDLKEFISVAGGKYKLSQGTCNIKLIEIGKYPVTNNWYEEFIKAGGYKNKDFWSDDGKKWLEKQKCEQPELWNDRKWKCPNSPVIGVSWYEAYAFTRWLTIELKDGYEYRLPNENEWEAAASGDMEREYPWGNEWDKNKCNSIETNIEKTTPVGIFNNGNTPEGISDLSGNIFEWTDSWYDNQKDYLVLRGGSWINLSYVCRCAFRHFNVPFIRGGNIGFRCARTLTL